MVVVAFRLVFSSSTDWCPGRAVVLLALILSLGRGSWVCHLGTVVDGAGESCQLSFSTVNQIGQLLLKSATVGVVLRHSLK